MSCNNSSTTKKSNKKINKKIIKEKFISLTIFIKISFKKTKIGVLGTNPHCETTDKFDEDLKILTPTIKILKKHNYRISGPYPQKFFLKITEKNLM